MIDSVRAAGPACTPRARIAYRAERGIDRTTTSSMGVAVQRMVRRERRRRRDDAQPGERRPLEDRHRVELRAGGDASSAAQVTPDSFLVDKVMLDIVESTSARRTPSSCADPRPRRHRARRSRPERRIAARRCRATEVERVAELAKRPSGTTAAPQDVEWAVADDATVVLLQSRPETVWTPGPQQATRSGQAIATGMTSLVQHAHEPAGREEDRRMSTPTAKRFISPYDDPAPEGAEGWQELYPYYLHFTRRAPRGGGGEASGSPISSTGRGSFKPVRHDHRRVRLPLPRPVQHAPLHHPAGQRDRLPRPQRLPLHEPGRPCRRRTSRRASPSSSSARATTSPTGRRCWRTGTQGPAR